MNNQSVLIVDDMPANLQLLSDILTKNGYSVRMAPSANLALKNIDMDRPHLILADIKMPGMSGFEFCKILKNDPKTSDIPIIFISALGQTEDKVKAFESGGVDYITKPFQVDEVLVRVSTHLSLYSLQRKLKEANEELKKLAAADPLTGLFNKRHFFDLARKEFSRAKRYDKNISLMMIDLDNFKAVNDNCGHICGDNFLTKTAELIRDNSREVDIPGRFGGDEFVILVPESTRSHTLIMAERLCRTIPPELQKLFNTDISVTLSIGITHYYSEEDVTFDTLFDQADKALYQAKHSGRNCIRVWDN